MFVGPPYSDAGEHCEVLWSALGVQWRFRWINGYTEFRVAAEVVAFFQMAVAELGGTDLDVVPGKFLADINLSDNISSRQNAYRTMSCTDGDSKYRGRSFLALVASSRSGMPC
jgi:uncharacterized membrane protein